MRKHILTASLYLFSCLAYAEPSLTEQETRWLTAAAPVLAYSQRLELPIDIVVQPQARPSDVPLAMGFDAGRCKLVVSLRGNSTAEEILDRVPDGERGLLIEAMAAHEVGHCWRYVQGEWHALPAGFVEVGEERADNAALLADAKSIRETRREEGYADLVALAWIYRNHPQHYDRVYSWLATVRGNQPVPNNAHDTSVWLRLARDAGSFAQGATPFDAAGAMWNQGLLIDE